MTEAPQPPSGDTPDQPPSSGAAGQPSSSGAPGSYPPPPPGGYPAGGYPGGPGMPPPGYPTADDKTWALLAHFLGPVGVIVGGGLLGWVGPLIAMLGRGNLSPTVRAHAVAALNFQLTWAIATLVAWVIAACTLFLLFFIPMLVWIVPVVFGIIGGVRANDGQLYRYPLSINLVK